MNKNYFIYILLFIGLFGIVSAVNICSGVPTADYCVMNVSYTMPYGTYYLNGSNNGTFWFNATNIILDCNGSTIIGNKAANKYGISDFNYIRANITIQNCTFTNFSIGFNWNYLNNSLILNSNFSKNGYNIVTWDNYVGSNFNTNVTFRNDVFDDSYNNDGIYIEGGSNYVFDNISSKRNYGYGLRTVTHRSVVINNSNISGNSIGRAAGANVWIGQNCDNATVTNNDLSKGYGLTGNAACVNPNADRGVYRNNTIIGCGHSGINFCNDWSMNYNVIDSNYLYNTSIYECSGGYNNFTNNRIVYTGYSDTGLPLAGIQISDDNNLKRIYGLYVFNNTIINSTTACIIDGTLNNTYISNNLSYCNNSEVIVYNSWSALTQNNTAKFINNIFPLGYARYIRDNTGAFNITIQENTSLYTSVQCPININTYVVFNYSGTKNFTINNCTVNVINQLSQYPYNDLKNLTDNNIMKNNINNYSFTLESGHQYGVDNYSSINISLYTIPSGLVTDVCIAWNWTVFDPDSVFNYTSLNVSYGATNTILKNYSLSTYNTLCNLPNGNYNWYITVVDNISSNADVKSTGTFSINYHGSDITGNNNPGCSSAAVGASNALGELPNWLLLITVIFAALIIMGLIGGLGYGLMYQGMDLKELLPLIVILIVTSIIVVVGIVIMGAVC